MMRCILCLLIIFLFSCRAAKQQATLHTSQQLFWAELNKLCGKAFRGEIINAPADDTVFRNRELFLHIRSCKENELRIPFVAGSNRSRTFIISRKQHGLELKHDHRHADGHSDSISMYGGTTVNSGTPLVQFFPADQATVNMLPAAGGNVWWLEIKPGEFISYNLRRMGTDRIFTVKFNLASPVAPPPAPWGWVD